MGAFSSGLVIRPPAPFLDLSRYIRHMRVLILTHPRSGGFSLLAWISKELGLPSYHEPFLNPQHAQTHMDAWTSPRIAVKEDISHLHISHINVSQYMSTFDRVILHVRKDVHATAISWVRQLESGESHVPYRIDEQWLEEHAVAISQKEMQMRVVQNAILWQENEHTLSTSYEGIYHSGEDIDRICGYLGISDPQWTDILHPKRRLQGGDPDLPPAIKKPKML